MTKSNDWAKKLVSYAAQYLKIAKIGDQFAKSQTSRLPDSLKSSFPLLAEKKHIYSSLNLLNNDFFESIVTLLITRSLELYHRLLLNAPDL